jgi:CMP-2-keto-3-deoxyoctulosonic acid synthetase
VINARWRTIYWCRTLAKVIEVFRNDFDKKVDLASLMREITEDINNPNNVKVVVDQMDLFCISSRL